MSEELKGFTPVAPDRDALLFAAGKAAARRWAGWKWLTLGLVATNVVTLGVLFWPKPAVNPSRPVGEPLPMVEPPEPYRPDPSSYIALRQGQTPPAVADDPPTPSAPLTPRAVHEFRIP